MDARSLLRKLVRAALALLLVLGAVLTLFTAPAYALNPPPLQTFYVTLPEDTMMQVFWDNFSGGTPRSPVRAITSITIGTYGTLVYYDQWEDGGYEPDIANPGSGLYDAVSNPAGTQIWGDGSIANGCPPSINNVPNPCTAPEHDRLSKGDVITLDYEIVVQGSSGSYARNPAQIFFDGRDKVGATLPIAVTRAMWPVGAGSPGSLVADAQGVLPTDRWSTAYVSPVGEDVVTTGQSYEDVRWLIMAGTDGTVISVDANGNGDYADANDLADITMAQGEVRLVDGIRTGATLTSDNPVQVTLLTADVNSTYENRFFNLIPRADWTHEYLTPVGTGSGTQCSNVWVYNPNAATITVNYRIGSGAPGSFTVGARAAAGSPNITTGNGARFWTDPPRDFLPISMTDCTNSNSGDIYDWGSELYPLNQLSPEITVGWAPGCSNEHPLGDYGVCLSTTGFGNTTNTKSRSVVWVTPLADTTLYVDLDGSGISCTSDPTGAGAEQVISANALRSVRIRNDPHNVRDMFSSTSYSNNGPGNYDATWASDWIEVGETTSPTGGRIRIADGALQFQNGTGGETNRAIHRAVNLAAMGYARLSFHSTLSGLGTNDRVAVEVSSTGAAGPYTLLQTYLANAATDVQIFDISAHATADTVIRFRLLDDWENDELWRIDNVNIDFVEGDGINGTYDMTGAYIRTCDETLLAAAVGQAPDLSFSSDNEGMDLGMGVPPYGSQMMLEKTAGVTFAAPGDAVTYTFAVRLMHTFSTSVDEVSVVDDRCAPTEPVLSGGYNTGDANNNSALDAGEAWIFTCTTHVFTETTNTAIAYAIYDGEQIRSAPDQATVLLTGLIGDYVWLDENSDGVKDAGEPGLANARVTLTGTDMDGNPVSLQTTTDSNGGYLFTDVPPGDAAGYAVSVDPGTLPAGLAANPTYDEDGTGTPHTAVVVLGSGEANRTADFGYNWASTADITNPGAGAAGAIGDRVWVDADGDGVQDPGEPGLPGVPVAIFYDADGDGVYDALYTGALDQNGATGTGTTTTSPDGSYAFYNLPPGAYVIVVNDGTPPTGYAQTGDSDQFGLPCTACDGSTTAPVVLAPGDVFVNADFGYQPSTSSSLSGTVYFDAAANEAFGGDDEGIAGVTVALLDAGGSVIATTTTDAAGSYTFTGLSAGSYTVWVNDTGALLNGLRQTEDQDAARDSRHTVVVNGTDDADGIDFGYAPAGHTPGAGLIGDTIFLDRDGDGQPGPGEGLQGAVVALYTGDGTTLLATTTTDANGRYAFGGLADGDYVVRVDTTALPNGGAGLTHSVDPDGGTPDESAVTISGGATNLDQDFGYSAATANTIAGTLWDDADSDTGADGTLDSGEAGRFAGVTVVLRDSAGNIVATTTTDASGDYSFPGLPDGTYTVDVTDETNILNGTWHSAGPNSGADNNSQPEPYTVTVSGGQTDTTADFGYYVRPAALGDRVWLDVNGDGIQDSYEPGLPGVEVTLVVAYPNGESSTVTTVTDANGFYSFGNLLLDEDFNGSGAGQPVHTLSVDTAQPALAALVASPIDVGGDDALDSDGPSGVVTAVVQGRSSLTYDFGFTGQVDTGNLLDSYNTLFSNNGPGHVLASLRLGTQWDADSDGQPGVTPSDNDGIVLDPNNAWRPGNTVTFTVTLAGPAEATGYLVAWIDWENDGSFSGMIVYDPLPVGSHALTLTVPNAYVAGTLLNVRFRLYETPPLGPAPSGVVIGGEVEDYQWEAKPTAVTFQAVSAVSPSAIIPPLLALLTVALLLAGSSRRDAGLP